MAKCENDFADANCANLWNEFFLIDVRFDEFLSKCQRDSHASRKKKIPKPKNLQCRRD